MEVEIDIQRLRDDLKNYFGSATPIYGVAIMDVIAIDNASDYEVINIATRNGFDLNDYVITMKL